MPQPEISPTSPPIENERISVHELLSPGSEITLNGQTYVIEKSMGGGAISQVYPITTTINGQEYPLILKIPDIKNAVSPEEIKKTVALLLKREIISQDTADNILTDLNAGSIGYLKHFIDIESNFFPPGLSGMINSYREALVLADVDPNFSSSGNSENRILGATNTDSTGKPISLIDHGDIDGIPYVIETVAPEGIIIKEEYSHETRRALLLELFNAAYTLSDAGYTFKDFAPHTKHDRIRVEMDGDTITQFEIIDFNVTGRTDNTKDVILDFTNLIGHALAILSAKGIGVDGLPSSLIELKETKQFKFLEKDEQALIEALWLERRDLISKFSYDQKREHKVVAQPVTAYEKFIKTARKGLYIIDGSLQPPKDNPHLVSIAIAHLQKNAELSAKSQEKLESLLKIKQNGNYGMYSEALNILAFNRNQEGLESAQDVYTQGMMDSEINTVAHLNAQIGYHLTAMYLDSTNHSIDIHNQIESITALIGRIQRFCKNHDFIGAYEKWNSFQEKLSENNISLPDEAQSHAKELTTLLQAMEMKQRAKNISDQDTISNISKEDLTELVALIHQSNTLSPDYDFFDLSTIFKEATTKLSEMGVDVNDAIQRMQAVDLSPEAAKLRIIELLDTIEALKAELSTKEANQTIIQEAPAPDNSEALAEIQEEKLKLHALGQHLNQLTLALETEQSQLAAEQEALKNEKRALQNVQAKADNRTQALNEEAKQLAINAAQQKQHFEHIQEQLRIKEESIATLAAELEEIQAKLKAEEELLEEKWAYFNEITSIISKPTDTEPAEEVQPPIELADVLFDPVEIRKTNIQLAEKHGLAELFFAGDALITHFESKESYLDLITDQSMFNPIITEWMNNYRNLLNTYIESLFSAIKNAKSTEEIEAIQRLPGFNKLKIIAADIDNNVDYSDTVLKARYTLLEEAQIRIEEEEMAVVL